MNQLNIAETSLALLGHYGAKLQCSGGRGMAISCVGGAREERRGREFHYMWLPKYSL